MRGREVAAAVLYALLMGSLATPLLDSYFAGRVDWWAPAGMVVAANLGAGALAPRRLVLLLPASAGAVMVAVGANDPFGLVAAAAFTAMMVGLTAVGMALGRRERGRRTGAALLAIAVVPVAWGAVEHLRRGEVLTPAEQARLPIELSLGNLCPGASTDASTTRRVRGSAAALIDELGRRPYALVDHTQHWAHGDPERMRITVRELAEEGLADLRSGGGSCAPDLQRRIDDAL